MRTLMREPAWVHYGQIYVGSSADGDAAGLEDCLGGQRNGLCGAAFPGVLFLITGLHTGRVGFAVEAHDRPPPIDGGWEEIVEVSFTPAGRETALAGWGGEGYWPLDLDQIDYRVRYCGSGLDAARDADPPADPDSFVDRYLLQFWPGSPEPDRVVKQTSATAAYWHDYARTLPAPPTPAERAERKRQAILERDRRDTELEQERETREWGGRLPSERLRGLGWTALGLARLDRPVVDALEEAGARTQRTVARWAARRAFAEAQLTRLEWIAPALDAMDRGEQMPAEVRDSGAFDRVIRDERVAHRLITTLDGRSSRFSQPAMAFPALRAAYDEDPLKAAIEAVRIAVSTFGFGREREFFAELRAAFPGLG